MQQYYRSTTDIQRLVKIKFWNSNYEEYAPIWG